MREKKIEVAEELPRGRSIKYPGLGKTVQMNVHIPEILADLINRETHRQKISRSELFVNIMWEAL